MNNLKIIASPGHSHHRETLVQLNGNLSAMDAIEFKSQLKDYIQTYPSDMLVDLSGLDTIDLAGINALAVAHKKLESSNRKLQIIVTENCPANELLHLTKFDKVLHVKKYRRRA